MSRFSISRVVRIPAGLAVLCAFAAAPMVARADDTDATGTLTAGALSNTAPGITPFSLYLSGQTESITTNVNAWNVTDATGSNDGYSVTVAASNPTVNGVAADAGTGATLTLSPTTATANPDNPAPTGPVAVTSPVLLSTTPATIDTAAPGTGQGEWDFPADPVGVTQSLLIVIPGDASAGDYSSTLTFTAAAPAAG
jgi:hypothetical protein